MWNDKLNPWLNNCSSPMIAWATRKYFNHSTSLSTMWLVSNTVKFHYGVVSFTHSQFSLNTLTHTIADIVEELSVYCGFKALLLSLTHCTHYSDEEGSTYNQCWKFPQVRQSEADNFGREPGTFCWFFSSNLCLWFEIQGIRTYNYFWLSFKHCIQQTWVWA